MIIMMKLACHRVNTRWLQATLHSLISVRESDLPLSGSVIKHAMADRSFILHQPQYTVCLVSCWMFIG